MYDRYTELQKMRDELREEARTLELNHIKIKKMIRLLETTSGLPITFDDRLWLATIDQVTVCHDKLIFKFFDGTEIEELL